MTSCEWCHRFQGCPEVKKIIDIAKEATPNTWVATATNMGKEKAKRCDIFKPIPVNEV